MSRGIGPGTIRARFEAALVAAGHVLSASPLLPDEQDDRAWVMLGDSVVQASRHRTPNPVFATIVRVGWMRMLTAGDLPSSLNDALSLEAPHLEQVLDQLDSTHFIDLHLTRFGREVVEDESRVLQIAEFSVLHEYPLAPL